MAGSGCAGVGPGRDIVIVTDSGGGGTPAGGWAWHARPGLPRSTKQATAAILDPQETPRTAAALTGADTGAS